VDGTGERGLAKTASVIGLRDRRSANTPAIGATNKNGSNRATNSAVVIRGEPDNIRISPSSAINENQVPSSLIN